ncbi:MAG: hypothetical protein ACFFCZ_17090 [Promethearchaeota archaeon]
MSKILLKAPPRQRAAKTAELEEIKEIIEKFRHRGALNVFTAVPLEDLAIRKKTSALVDLINADVLRRTDPKTNSLWGKHPKMYYWDEIRYKKWIDESKEVIKDLESAETDRERATSLIQIKKEELALADRYKAFFLEKDATQPDFGVLKTSFPENLSFRSRTFLELEMAEVIKPVGEGIPLRQQFFFLDSQRADKWLKRTRRIQILFWLALIAFIVIMAFLILMNL